MIKNISEIVEYVVNNAFLKKIFSAKIIVFINLFDHIVLARLLFPTDIEGLAKKS